MRLFVALLPPPAVRAELAALAGPLSGVRWSPEANLHLTLRFIGEVSPEMLGDFETALAGVRVEPFVLPVSGIGVFPSRGPAKVLWVGTGHGHTRLHQLRKQVDEALLAVDPALEVRSFHAHFTLGRMAEPGDPKALAKFTAHHASFEAPPFRVAEFSLMASEFQPAGPPAYRIVRTFALVR